jgi:tRNA-specific 2-thiouridylase
MRDYALHPNAKIIVALSGGVDSSVSALLLKRRGYAIEGLFMKNWEEDDTETCCAAAEDVQDARSVCESLGIGLHTVNLSAEYWDEVFSPFLDGYRAGRTPNPDILCNREIKFKAFLEHARELGADLIATGHYARIRRHDGSYQLLKSVDQSKDQSYFLYALTQPQLARSLFPLGDLKKTAVRQLAAGADLINHNKKDSTGICFIGERPFRSFISRYLPAQPGEIRTVDGQLVGHHPGVIYYTLGQRKGLGIGGIKNAKDAPWYVIDKDLGNNVLIVGQEHGHPRLFSQRLEATVLNWIAGNPPSTPYRCRAKTRYRQADQACIITSIEDNRCEAAFDTPQWAITPGQSVVFYQGEVCLGGGIIEAFE